MQTEIATFFEPIFSDFRDRIKKLIFDTSNPKRQYRHFIDRQELGEYYFNLFNAQKNKEVLNKWLEKLSQEENHPKREKIRECIRLLHNIQSMSLSMSTKLDIYKPVADLVGLLLGFSVFRIDESYNTIHYEYIYSSVVSNEVLDDIVIQTSIPFGHGSIGYLTRSNYPLCISSTNRDMRGTVSIEDFIIGNRSFMAMPIICKEIDRPDDKGKLLGMVACFFPIDSAFTANGLETVSPFTDLNGYKLNGNFIVQEFSKTIERYKPSIEYFWNNIEKDTVIKKLLQFSNQKRELLSVDANSKELYNNILDLLFKDVSQSESNKPGRTRGSGLTFAAVWKVDEDSPYPISFIAGAISESYLLKKLTSLVDQAGELKRWETRAHIQTEKYCKYYTEENLSWVDGVIFEGDSSFDKSYLEIQREYEEIKDQREKLKQAQFALDTYQYGEEGKIQDILIPLGFQKEMLGVLRINCAKPKDGDYSRTNILCKEISKHESDFELICHPLYRFKHNFDNESKNYLHKKVARELESGYLTIILDWWRNKSSDYEKYSARTREFLKNANDIYSEHFTESDLLIEITLFEAIINSIRNIYENVVREFLQDPIILMSAWLTREKPVIIDSEDSLPVLRKKKGDELIKCHLHRAINENMADLKEFQNEPLKFLEKSDYIEKPDDWEFARKVAEEYFAVPTFKWLERMIGCAIIYLDAKQASDYVKFSLDEKDSYGPIVAGNEPIIYGSLLSRKDRGGFKHLYVFRTKRMQFISIVSQKELIIDERTLNEWWEKEKQNITFYTIESTWTIQDKVERVVSKYIPEIFEKHFVGRNEGKRIDARQLNLKLSPFSIKELFEEFKKKDDDIQFHGPIHLQRNEDGDGVFDELLDIHDKYLNVVIPATDSIEHALATTMEFRFLYILPIVVENRLVSIINLYSAYLDPINPKISNFEPPNTELFRIIESYCEDRFTYATIYRREESARVIKGNLHMLRNMIASVQMTTCLLDPGSGSQESLKESVDDLRDYIEWTFTAFGESEQRLRKLMTDQKKESLESLCYKNVIRSVDNLLMRDKYSDSLAKLLGFGMKSDRDKKDGNYSGLRNDIVRVYGDLIRKTKNLDPKEGLKQIQEFLLNKLKFKIDIELAPSLEKVEFPNLIFTSFFLEILLNAIRGTIIPFTGEDAHKPIVLIKIIENETISIIISNSIKIEGLQKEFRKKIYLEDLESGEYVGLKNAGMFVKRYLSGNFEMGPSEDGKYMITRLSFGKV